MNNGKCPNCGKRMFAETTFQADGLVVTIACANSNCEEQPEYGTYVYFGDMELTDN